MKEISPLAPGIFPPLPNGVHAVNLGNGTRFDILMVHDNGGVAIGVFGRGCYRFSHGPHPSYVAEKLGLMHYYADAENLSDLIACQIAYGDLGGPVDAGQQWFIDLLRRQFPNTWKPNGRYDDNLLHKPSTNPE